jgi:hypothetical protein
MDQSIKILMIGLNPRERIGFAELSAKWRIGSPLLAAESASIKNLP